MEGTIALSIDDDKDDDDISILSANPPLHKKGSNSNPIVVDNYKNDDFDDISILNANTPISVERYTADKDLQMAIMASLSSTRERIGESSTKSQWAREFTGDQYYYVDQDDVQVLDVQPRKYFKGESSNSKDHDTEVESTFMCEICADEKLKSLMFKIVGCDHSYCSDCICKYIASKLQENISSISCPAMGCDGKLEPQHCSSILPRQVFDRWGDALCEALILGTEKFYCPYKDCSYLLINDSSVGSDVTESECPECHRLFCARCKAPWHSEVSCEEFQKLGEDENKREDIQLMKLAEKNRWKRCPRCSFYVERSTGCLFMVCRCKFTFCYNCGAEVKSHYCYKCGSSSDSEGSSEGSADSSSSSSSTASSSSEDSSDSSSSSS